MSGPRSITIDGAEYLIGRIPPRRSLGLQNRLIRVAGPGIVALISSVKPGPNGKVSLDELDMQAIASALQGLLAQLTPAEQDAIMEELFTTVQVIHEGRAAPVLSVFDVHFADRMPAVYKLMWAALEENFGGFFGPLAAAAVRAAQALRSRGSSATPRSGPPGASS